MDERKAMDKIRDEMAAKSNDGAIQAIGQMLTAQLEADPQLAGKVLAQGKTLAGAYKALEDYAKNNRAGRSCVYVPPEKAMEIVAGYYGMDAAEMVREARTAGSRASGEQETHAHADVDELDLDALLGL